MPCLIVLAILRVLPEESVLPNYLSDTVFVKIRRSEVSFEEMLLFRLTADIGRTSRDVRSPEFT